jgi:hypothetical protein
MAAKDCGRTIREVPDSGVTVSAPGQKLFSVGREGHRQHLVAMSAQRAPELAGLRIPQAHGAVSRPGGKETPIPAEGDGNGFTWRPQSK